MLRLAINPAIDQEISDACTSMEMVREAAKSRDPAMMTAALKDLRKRTNRLLKLLSAEARMPDITHSFRPSHAFRSETAKRNWQRFTPTTQHTMEPWDSTLVMWTIGPLTYGVSWAIGRSDFQFTVGRKAPRTGDETYSIWR